MSAIPFATGQLFLSRVSILSKQHIDFYYRLLLHAGSLKWLSNAYRNGISSRSLDWGNQIVLITGGTTKALIPSTSRSHPPSGSSGVGELLANTLSFRNVTVVVLDIKPIVSDASQSIFLCPM